MAEHDPSRDRPSAPGPDRSAAGKTADRREREAAALRANLSRRRAQKQARAASDPDEPVDGTR